MTILKKWFKKPLDITISILFILLIFTLGLVLNLYNYRKITDLSISATNNLFNELANEVTIDFEATYSPVFQIVSLLSHTDAVQGTTLEQHLDAVPLFVDVLKQVPAISGLQVGYANGEYFIVRPLPSENEHILFSAPEKAVYLFDYVSRGVSGNGLLQRIFLDGELQEISRSAPMETDFNPLHRPWYAQALQSTSVVATSPYFFYFLHKVGLTVARQAPDGSAVVAVDITLEQVADTLAHLSFSPHEKKLLLDENGGVLACDDLQMITRRMNKSVSLPALKDLDTGLLHYVAENIELKPGVLNFSYDDRDWLGMVAALDIGKDIHPSLLMLVPADEILVEARRIRRDIFFLTLFILSIAIPITWFISRSISKSIQQLAREARQVSRFDFSSSLEVSSQITEVDELASSMRMMRQTVSHFIALIQSIAGEKNFETTLKRITLETMTVSRADMVVSYLVDDEQRTLVPDVVMDRQQGSVACTCLSGVPLADFFSSPGEELMPIRMYSDQDRDMGGLAGVLGTSEVTVVPIPLVDRQGDLIGLLALLYREIGSRGELDNRLSFTRAFSGFAAVSLETRQLIKKQKRLLDSFIALLAGAIDAKSPYTGGHCQRVPVITEMLARAACACHNGPFRDFSLSEEEQEELHIAAWLHDCGKVTTPEYVVDKATKLETIYNRIHEIRTRFEVLKRDAEIKYWQQLAEGGDRETLRKHLEEVWRQLDDDFSFLAACNSGDEALSSEHLERLRAIAGRTWLRTLDDRLGLSWEEMHLREGEQEKELPVREHLLADKFEHRIPRPVSECLPAENLWDFKLDVPEYLYNHGELYNLQIERGTLTPEERYKIKDHIVQTIRMLTQLPFPAYLRRVPEIAGCHHETMSGTGYPRGLSGDRMSLTARMMTIADIFEALTASDRPYKKAKKLSEALRILFFMKKEQHIDPQLFDLFLTSGVYLEYAEQYLDPEQIDAVDISDYLG